MSVPPGRVGARTPPILRRPRRSEFDSRSTESDSGPAVNLVRAIGNREFGDLVHRRTAQPTEALSGTALPAAADAAHAVLGGGARAVRVHTGPAADAALADRPDALAMTRQSDIFVSQHAPSLESPGGRLLLAHEAAHVVQQTRADDTAEVDRLGSEGDVAEREADQAAVDATLGGPLTALSAAAGPQYFEARWHQASLTGAMADAGLTDAEQEAAYFGNWCRDLSQAFVPMASSTVGTTAAFELVNLLAMHHFGHGVTPAQLGAYDPRQHIDNPAGTTDRDVMADGVDVPGHTGVDPITGTAAGHAGIDKRTGTELSSAEIAASFAVDDSGVPAYITRSKEYIRSEATLALEEGRNERGLFHVGNFSHTCEDLFAHSNWIEIAIGRLLQEGSVTLPPGDTRDEVDERLAANRPPIENFSADVADRAGRARPILSTGTFSGGGAGNDTVMSIKAEAQNLLRDREPFKEDGGGGGEMYDFALEVLRHAQSSAAEGSIGPIFADVVEQALGNLGSGILSGVDALPAMARDRVGGRFGDLLGGAASLLSDGAHAASDLVGDAWQSGLRSQVEQIVNGIAPTALTLGEGLVWVKSGVGAIGDAWTALKNAVRGLPKAIKEMLLPKLVQAEREFKKRIRALANAAYASAVQALVDTIEGLHPVTDTAETNVGQKLEHWQQEFVELRASMQRLLREVGGTAGAELADQVAAMNEEEVIGFARSPAFLNVLNGLVGDAAAQARLSAAAGDLDDKGNQVAQLEAVPEWARAGASHSQTAKDHDDGAFFGIAFAVAREADGTMMRLLQEAWSLERGEDGPTAELADQFGELDKTGELPDADGVSDMERARRQSFLNTRAAGAHVVEHGAAENADIGPRLVALGEGLQSVVLSYPGVEWVVRKLIDALNANSDCAALMKELSDARVRWEQYAGSGELDDELMASVDRGLAAVSRAIGLMAHAETGDHDESAHEDHAQGVDMHHPHEVEGHNHGNRTEVFFQEQIDTLDRYRAASRTDERIPGRLAGVTSEGDLRDAVAVSGDREGEVPFEEDADTIVDPRERLYAEIDRIFGHPYDSNWWVPSVATWCRAHPDVLERSVRDRNHGVMHSHAH